MSRRRRLRALAIDVSPLAASRDFRMLWLGQLVSNTGSQLRIVAVPYQVWLLTESPLAVGMLGLVQAIPLMAFSLWGGVIADAVNRRRLLLFTQAGLAGVSVVLAVGTQAGMASVPFLYAVTALGAALSAIDNPARTAMIPALVGRAKIPAAMALNQVLFQTSSVAGPAVAGLILARLGLAATYWIDVVSFAAAWFAVLSIRSVRESPGGTRPGLRSLLDGIAYLRGHHLLLGVMGLDFAAMLFGWPRSLFPHFAENVFEAGPQGLGLLFAAPGAGALAGALLAGWVSNVRRQGVAVMWCVVVWGVAIAGFGMVDSFRLALVLLAVAGAADVFSAIFRGTILQMSVPDHLRGRMTSVNMMFVIGGPRFGELESGVVAALIGARFSVISGGLACLIAVVIVLVAAPSVRRYRTDAAEAEEPSEGAAPAGAGQ